MANKNPNTKGLNPVRSEKEARKKGKKGGENSGKARKAKKPMQELASMMLQMASIPKTKKKIKEDFPNIADEDLTNAAAIINSQIGKAVKGDTRSAEFIRDTSGQKPTEKFEQVGERTVAVDDKPDNT